jgi:ubiquinone/menaquinone biosynthesis C-methylase UbiE
MLSNTIINNQHTKAYSPEIIGSNDISLISLIDELPLWSAPFGIKMLDVIEYKRNSNMLDIGCGSGFPLIEIAQRLGESSNCYGIDPWETAIIRLKEKATKLQLKNIRCYDCKAEEMPFEDDFFDLIVSNNGINNTENAELVLNECFRTAKKSAQLVITANLPATFSLLYETITEILLENGHYNVIESFIAHINQKRKSIKEQTLMIHNAGFNIRQVYEENYTMKFLDGSAFLNHSFIKTAFKNIWFKLLLPTQCAEEIFAEVEHRLNEISISSNLQMEVPFVVFDCFKS